MKANDTFRTDAENPLFCALRVWDQRAETGYSRPIEIEFQRLADSVLAGKLSLDEVEHLTISKFWALWKLRAEARQNSTGPATLHGIYEATELSHDQQEVLERKHYAFLENGNQIPSHILTGLRMQMEIDRLTVTPIRWGLIHSSERELIVPDNIGSFGFVPLTPNHAFLANHDNATITADDALQINHALLAGATQYIFARSVSRGLGKDAT